MNFERKKRIRNLNREHEEWLKSQGLHSSLRKRDLSGIDYNLEVSRPTPYNTSHNVSGNTNKPDQKIYTGSLIKGIATMHKSNAIPIINEEQAIEISKMRR